MKNSIYITVIALVIGACSTTKHAGGDAQRWLQAGSWSNGFSWKPHASIDAATFRSQYAANKAYWDLAFSFLGQTDLSALPAGRHPIDGENVYASVTHNPSRDLDSTEWEAHRDYIDIQAVIAGEELIGVHPVASAVLTKPYDAKRDVANYKAEGTLHTARPGTFFIFFPTDAHRPNITPGGNRPVKKIVIKLRAAKL